MELLLSVLSVVVGLAALLTKRADLSSWVRSVLYVLEVLVLFAVTIQLGWIGLLLAVLAFLLGTIVASVRLAMKKETLLNGAAAQGAIPVEDGKDLCRWARRQRRLKAVGPIRICEFILALSQRGRDPSEAKEMLEPLGMLYIIYEIDPHVLTEKFDRIMRLWNKPSSEAEQVADRLVAASKASAATFEDMLDAMASFGEI